MIDLDIIKQSCEEWRSGKRPADLCATIFAGVVIPALIKEIERLQQNQPAPDNRDWK